MVTSTQVKTGFQSTMELETEKVFRDFSTELVIALPYFSCDAWDGGGAIGGGHDAGLVEVEVAAARPAKAVEFLQEEQDIFYVNCCATIIDIT